MIGDLVRIVANELHVTLADKNHPWKTLDVTYEDPRVERVWTSVGRMRLALHRIHPCAKPLYHPHPWPSAMWLASGAYVMGVGRAPEGSGEPPVECVRTTLFEGSYYEMLDRRAWHWVNPVASPVMTVMLTGEPWEVPPEFPKHGKGHVHRELSDAAREDILEWFRRKLGVTPR